MLLDKIKNINNTEEFENLVNRADFLEASLTEKIENLNKILNNENFKKLENVEKYIKKMKKIEDELLDIKNNIIATKAVIKTSERGVEESMFSAVKKIDNIINNFEQYITKNLEEILNEKFKKIAEKRILIYEKNTINVFKKFDNILKNYKNVFKEELEKIKNLKQEIKEEIEKKYTDFKYFPKENEIKNTQQSNEEEYKQLKLPKYTLPEVGILYETQEKYFLEILNYDQLDKANELKQRYDDKEYKVVVGNSNE